MAYPWLCIGQDHRLDFALQTGGLVTRQERCHGGAAQGPFRAFLKPASALAVAIGHSRTCARPSALVFGGGGPREVPGALGC
jgi:hypothetical protein